MTFVNSENSVKKKYFHLELLITYLKPFWPKMLLLTILLLSNIGLQLLNPQILRNYINTALSTASISLLLEAAVVFLIVILVGQAVTALTFYFSEDISWLATNRLRETLTLHCLQLDLNFHKEHTPGEMVERIDGDVIALADFFSQFVVRFLGNLILIIGIIALIFIEDWRVGFIFSIYTLIGLLLFRRVHHVAIPHFKKVRQITSELTGFWGELLGSFEDVRSSGAEDYILERHYTLQRLLLRAGLVMQMMSRILQSVWEILTATGSALILALGAILVTQGSINLGSAYLLFNYINLLTFNLYALSVQLDSFQKATAGIERINELFAIPNLIKDGPGINLDTIPEIEFRNVSYSYVENKPILHNLSFKLPAGQALGLLGRTGSGKSTLSRLLFRFADPQQGQILLNGNLLKEFQVSELRHQIGLVTQEVEIFNATLRDNLIFWDKTITDERILAALHSLGLANWLSKLEKGLDTPLEQGGGMSAGEAQLIALARVFLKNPKIIILDEPSSRLDPATERIIFNTVSKLIEGRTTIIIAHHLATVSKVDHIMILENGRIIELGRRADLAKIQNSRYSSLIETNTQYLSQKEEEIFP